MKGFVISWFYPPINSSEGLVTFKLLNRSEIKHDVFTQKGNQHWSYKKENKLQNKDIKTIFGNSTSYDDWVDSCVEYFDKHHKEYDFIMSRSMPPESHIAAMKIKNKYPHIKWIASFGDPINFSPYDSVFDDLNTQLNYPVSNAKEYLLRYMKRPIKKAFINHQARHIFKKRKELNTLELEIFKSADLIIFNNPYQKQFMLDHYKELPKINSIILPHSFEDSFYDKGKRNKDKPLKKDKEFIITHTGHLDHLRTPLPFLKALTKIKLEHPSVYDKLKVNFFGTFDNTSKIYILDNKLFDIVEIHKPIDYFSSLSKIMNSDLNLVIDANFSSKLNRNIYFAAKIADYIGARAPIFAITSPEGASSDIIRDTGNHQSSHSVDEIVMKLMGIINNNMEIEMNSAKTTYIKYNAKSVAKKYDNVVKKLLKSGDRFEKS